GSAAPFVMLLKKAGIKKQKAARKVLRIKKSVSFGDGNKSISAEPYDGFLVEYTIDFPHPLIGVQNMTIDLNPENFDKLAKEENVGLFVAPNFAIGAILMMRFAREAAKYFPHVEIIELHHDQKLDAPSGTAIKTLEEIAKVRQEFRQGHEQEYEKIAGARGGDFQGMRVHSIRLPGLIAHQEVILGGIGQTLSIKHDSLSRECFMPGIMLAIKKVISWKGLVSGLENIL
ncbi:MAG: 4-hydroxy-tetrahydrodipicolinate reductase, partial [Clostridia bacterium]|nr:4-hydroxy-tetrahydrodipicolinate reductase [Clostridia bacterium]